ncbi:MAG: DUF2063 domain-containing protein, partial [Polaromonas sp.]
DHKRIRFTPHPSASLVHTGFPADMIWRAVLADDNDAELAAIELSGDPAWLLVQRGPSGVDMLRLEPSLWHFAGALFSGCPLGLALAAHPAINAPVALAELLVHGRFTAFGLAEHADLVQPSRSLS